jgi:hypothetical protein
MLRFGGTSSLMPPAEIPSAARDLNRELFARITVTMRDLRCVSESSATH